MWKYRVIIAASMLLCCFGESLIAQQSGPGTTTTTSTAGAQAVIYNNGQGSGSRTPLPNAYPVSQPVFPGIAIPPGPNRPDTPAIHRTYTLAEVDSARRVNGKLPKGWEKRVKVTIFHPELAKLPNPNAKVTSITWDPEGDITYAVDTMIAKVIAKGKPDEPDDQTKALAEWAALQSGCSRTYTSVQQHYKTDTNGRNYGLGGALAVVTGNGTSGGAVSGGFGKASSSTSVEDYPTYTVSCLNSGPVDPPKFPVVETRTSKKLSPQSEEEETGRTAENIARALEPAFEKLIEKLQPQQQQSQLQPQPTTQPTVMAPAEACSLPEFAVYFKFNKAEIENEYRPEIQKTALWLKSHSECHLQVEGHTDKVGTHDYNAVLGRNRAKAVYDALAAAGAPMGLVVIQFVSVSKDRPAVSEVSEIQWENRRVILRVIGSASKR